MRINKILALIILTTGFAFCSQNVQAEKWNQRKINRADRNNDDRVGPREFKREKKRINSIEIAGFTHESSYRCVAKHKGNEKRFYPLCTPFATTFLMPGLSNKSKGMISAFT